MRRAHSLCSHRVSKAWLKLSRVLHVSFSIVLGRWAQKEGVGVAGVNSAENMSVLAQGGTTVTNLNTNVALLILCDPFCESSNCQEKVHPARGS